MKPVRFSAKKREKKRSVIFSSKPGPCEEEINQFCNNLLLRQVLNFCPPDEIRTKKEDGKRRKEGERIAPISTEKNRRTPDISSNILTHV